MRDTYIIGLIERLREQADEIDAFNERLRSAGTPDDGLQRNWQREAADALAAAEAVMDGMSEDLATLREENHKCVGGLDLALAQARKDALEAAFTAIMRLEILTRSEISTALRALITKETG